MSEFLNVFPNGLSLFREGENQYSLRDTTGNIVMTSQYDLVENSLAGAGILIRKDGLLGIMGDNGKMLLPPEYEQIGRGYCDTDGEEDGAYNIILDPICPVKRRGFWAFIHKEYDSIGYTWKEFTPCYKTILCSYKQGYATVQDKSTELILVNEEGREIWNVDTYEGIKYAEYIGNHYAIISDFRKYYRGIYDLDAHQTVIDTEYVIKFIDYDVDKRETYLMVDGEPTVFRDGEFWGEHKKTCPNYSAIIESTTPRRRKDENYHIVNI